MEQNRLVNRLNGDGTPDLRLISRIRTARPNFHSMSDWAWMRWYVSLIMAMSRLINTMHVTTRYTLNTILAKTAVAGGERSKSGILSGSVKPNKAKKSSTDMFKGSGTITLPVLLTQSWGYSGWHKAVRLSVKAVWNNMRITANRHRSFIRSRMIMAHGPNKWWNVRNSSSWMNASIIATASRTFRANRQCRCDGGHHWAKTASRWHNRAAAEKPRRRRRIHANPARSPGNVSSDTSIPQSQISNRHSDQPGTRRPSDRGFTGGYTIVRMKRANRKMCDTRWLMNFTIGMVLKLSGDLSNQLHTFLLKRDKQYKVWTRDWIYVS